MEGRTYKAFYGMSSATAMHKCVRMRTVDMVPCIR